LDIGVIECFITSELNSVLIKRTNFQWFRCFVFTNTTVSHDDL